MVRTATEAALSPLGTIDGAVVGEDFPAFVTEAGVQGMWAAVRVRAMVRLEWGFFGEYAPEHTCGDSGVNELMGGGEEVVVGFVKVLLEGLGGSGELLL